MPIEKICKVCGVKIKVYNTITNKCRECALKNAKPIKQRGKQAKLWDTFRDQVARPYLHKKYGIACTDCGVWPPIKADGTYYRHDVDHIRERGGAPHLRFDVKNMAYRCRSCHRDKTDRKN